MRLGIDFGTSFSLPATSYLNQNLILLPGGKYGIPSTFFYSDWEGVLVGEEAERAGQGTEAQNLKREIKLELTSSFTADGRTFSAKQIVGFILNEVKQNAVSIANEKMMNSEIEGVVLSVPAAFGHNEKTIIKEAAEIPVTQGGPGLKVLGFIKEPVAAALSYFNTSLADKTQVLVYDLGGGTCDIALVEADSTLKEKYTVIDSEMIRVGGKDWDKRLEIYIAREIEKQSGKTMSNIPAYMEKIKREAVIAKHAFSETVAGKYRDRVRARVEIDGLTYQVPITKDIFDNLTKDLFMQTLDLVKTFINRNSSNVINKIVCVGGGSRMPQVFEGLKREFPTKSIQVYEPDKAIAIGASIYAQHCDDFEKNRFLSDIAAFSYGTEIYEHYDINPNDYAISNLIKKGERLPAKRKKSYMTPTDDCTKIDLSIIENSNYEDSYKHIKGSLPVIMDVVLDFERKVPKHTSVYLTLTLNTDGLLEASAVDGDGHQVYVKKNIYLQI